MAQLDLSKGLKNITEEGANYYIADVPDLFEVLPFKPIKNIGSGGSGEVFLMESLEKPGLFTAAKAFSFSEEDKHIKWAYFLREVGILQQLNHKNIISILCPVICPYYGIIVMDYFVEGALYQSLSSLLPKQIHRYFVQISCAIRHVHSKRIVHRDIKLDNILIRNDVAYLTDFGLSQKLGNDNSMVSRRVGTKNFMAPEVMRVTPTTEYDGFKADSWAMGVFLWCLMLREEPNKNTKLLETIESRNLDLKQDLFGGPFLNPTLLECVRRLLQPDPKDRWDITLLLEDLRSNGYRSWQIEML